MKSFAVILLVCCVVGTTKAMTKDEMIVAFKKMASECATMEGATNDDIAEITARKYPSTRAGKCVHACLGETIGIMRDNQIDMERTAAVAKFAFDDDAEKIKMAMDLANDCVGVTDNDRCEAAAKIFECGHGAAKKRGISFEDV